MWRKIEKSVVIVLLVTLFLASMAQQAQAPNGQLAVEIKKVREGGEDKVVMQKDGARICRVPVEYGDYVKFCNMLPDKDATLRIVNLGGTVVVEQVLPPGACVVKQFGIDFPAGDYTVTGGSLILLEQVSALLCEFVLKGCVERPIGGELQPIDAGSLFIDGVSMNVNWMLPLLGIAGAMLALAAVRRLRLER